MLQRQYELIFKIWFENFIDSEYKKHFKGNSGFSTSWAQMKEHVISKKTSHH